MRGVLGCLMLISLMFMALGCASSGSIDAGGAGQTCVMQSGGRNVLRLTVARDVGVEANDGVIKLESHERDADVHVWIAAGAKTLEEAAGQMSHVIEPEFKHFKTTSSMDLTIAGMPAKRMTGIGAEADDGDPGYADVVIFAAGDHFFVACTHGEGLAPEAQEWMLAVARTAQAP